MKNAIKLKDLNPRSEVFILYRDMMTYGFKERYYKEAREKGIMFLQYDENRKPDIHVHISSKLRKISDWGALGYCIGKKAENKIPYITGIENADLDDLKSFCASVVTYGSKPLFYMKGMTPGSEKYQHPRETIIIKDKDIEEAYKNINDDFSSIDLVCIGCPHCSISEIAEIAELLKNKRISPKTEFWVACSRSMKQIADKRSYTKTIERAGGKFACDTCMAVAPLKGKFRNVVTTSAKGCYYSRHNNLMTKMSDLKKCIEAAVKGEWS